MSAHGKWKGKKASFHGIDIKIRRAEIQLRALDREFEALVYGNFYCFVPVIYDEGRTHIYKAVNPPQVGAYWGAQIGEVAHALRSSLDHLAWQLVISAGNSPGKRTQFPVSHRKPTKRIFKCLPYPRKRDRLNVSGKVPPRALDLIEAVQPYNRTYEGRSITAINELDNFDKHRELIVAATVVYQANTSYDQDGRTTTIEFPGKPIKDGEIVAIVNYDPPQLEPDPNLQFTPFITFAKGGPFEGQVAPRLLWDLWNFIANDLMVRFDEWVPMKGT